MNYRHAYHAGNFADVMKHVVLTRIVAHLKLKPAPFRIIDTHAGIGLYDLAGEEAARTGEWRDGIGRLADPFPADVEQLLAPYRDVVAAVRSRHGPDTYPGSPAILREMLRREDRAIVVERHPADAAALHGRLVGAANVKALTSDGWAALGGLIPPRERRGAVLIDPPFEEPDEAVRAPARLARAQRRWPTGTFAFWYPVKQAREADRLVAALVDALDVPALRLELAVSGRSDGRLAGSGLLVTHPPWTLETEAERLLPALAERLRQDPDGWARIERPGGARS